MPSGWRPGRLAEEGNGSSPDNTFSLYCSRCTVAERSHLATECGVALSFAGQAVARQQREPIERGRIQRKGKP